MNPQSPNGPQISEEKAPTSGLAIASLVLSLLGIGLPAVICGHIALSKIKKSFGAMGGRGLALAGLIIGYISILVSVLVFVAVLIPAMNGVSQQAEKTSAMSSAYSLENSISSYFTEYRKYPVEAGTSESDVILSDHRLMDTLLGSDPATEPGGLNPRGIAFFVGKSAQSMGDGKYRSGVQLGEGGVGELWDPWGNHYRVQLDLDYNSRIEKPVWDSENSTDTLPKSILVWSLGRDGIEGTADDIRTW
jgi:type II secretory pathway pseudopilin PulG